MESRYGDKRAGSSKYVTNNVFRCRYDNNICIEHEARALIFFFLDLELS